MVGGGQHDCCSGLSGTVTGMEGREVVFLVYLLRGGISRMGW